MNAADDRLVREAVRRDGVSIAVREDREHPLNWDPRFSTDGATLSAAAPAEGRLSIGRHMAVDRRSTVPGAVLATVGVVLLLVAFVWMSIVGYYPGQLPIIFVFFAAGALLAWQGQRMYQSAKRENALHRIKQRDQGKA